MRSFRKPYVWLPLLFVVLIAIVATIGVLSPSTLGFH